MPKSVININQGKYKKYKDAIEAEFGIGTPLLSIPYYVDLTAYWRRENYGIRIVDDPIDIRDSNKYSPVGGRFEHAWFGIDSVQSFVAAQTEQIFVVFNYPDYTSLQSQTAEGLVLSMDREIIWNEAAGQYEVNGIAV